MKRAGSRLLRSLEARLVALDEDLLLATAFLAAPPPARPQAERPRARLGFRRVEPSPRPSARLRFAPLPPEIDRVVIKNWNAETGLVPLGEVDLELDPGQAVTLRIRRASPTPVPHEAARDAPRTSLYFLPDQDLLDL